MKHNIGLPCSSKIPFGIFLSLELTTAFRCFLNLNTYNEKDLEKSSVTKYELVTTNDSADYVSQTT